MTQISPEEQGDPTFTISMEEGLKITPSEIIPVAGAPNGTLATAQNESNAKSEPTKAEEITEAEDNHSSSKGSSSLGSSSGTYVSLTGVDQKPLDVLGFVCFQATKRRNLQQLRIPFLVLEYLQLASFLFDPCFFPDSHGTAGFKYVRDFVAGTSTDKAAVSISVAGSFVVLHLFVFMVQYRFVYSGNLGKFQCFSY